MKIDLADIAKRFQIADKLLRCYSPVADLVIDKNIGSIVIAGLHSEPRITFYAGFRTAVRPVL